jgi:agmatinase
VDYGDCAIDHGRVDRVPGQVEHEARAILASWRPASATLGGDRFVTLPLLRAHAARHGPLALVQFDAHQDAWDDDGQKISHGTFAARAVQEGLIDPARWIQIGIRTIAPRDCGIAIIDAYAAHRLGVEGVAKAVAARATGPAYLAFDIDALDPAFAPGTGTPVAGGLSSAQASMMLDAIARALTGRGMGRRRGRTPPSTTPTSPRSRPTTAVQHYLQGLAADRQEA